MSKLWRVAPAVALTRPPVAQFMLAVALAAFLSSSAPVHAQVIKKLFAHDDVALSGSYVVGTSVTAIPPNSAAAIPVTEKPSTSAAIMVTGRYTHSRFIGFEANYSFTSLDEDFSIKNPRGGSPAMVPYPKLIGGAQSTMEELSLGYIAHAPTVFGVVPFVGAGIGVISFEPTPYGGQSLPPQARMEYYGTIGADAAFTPHFGVRAQMRDLFYMAPDYGQNYLTTYKHTMTFEPTIGFYYHF